MKLRNVDQVVKSPEDARRLAAAIMVLAFEENDFAGLQESAQVQEREAARLVVAAFSDLHEELRARAGSRMLELVRSL